MATKKEISEAAKTFSKMGAKKGGEARAKALTAEERSEIARHAATVRWKKAGKDVHPVLRATHSGEMPVGETIIPCAVLEDGTRLLTQEGFLKAIGRAAKAKGGQGASVVVDGPPAFLAANNLKPFISQELIESTTPVVFQSSKGVKAYGYKAELLPRVCEVYLKARDAGALLSSQKRLAVVCDTLMRGLAHIGIIALIDEATGYQEVRDRLALQKILEKYLRDEWAKWTKRFPDEFYKELFRLKDIPYPPKNMRRPSYVGHWTNDVVYKRLAPGVLKALREKNPTTSKGYRKHRFHQYLTDDIGVPELQRHLNNVIFLMRSCTSWDDFKTRLDLAAPKCGDTMSLPLE